MKTINNNKKVIFNQWLSKFILVCLFFGLFSITNSAQMISESGFENANEWDGFPWRKVPANVTLFNDSREGNSSVRFRPISNQKRSELVLEQPSRILWNTEYWVGFSIKVKEAVEGFNIIFQHHESGLLENIPNVYRCIGGSNGLTFKTKDNNLNIYTVNPNGVNRTFPNPVPHSATWDTELKVVPNFTKNEWHDIVIHLKYTVNNTGFMEIWVDGDKKINLHNQPTVHRFGTCWNVDSNNNYTGGPITPTENRHFLNQKIGMYYGNNNQSGDILYDAYRIGKGSSITYEDVSPLGLSPGDSNPGDTTPPSTPTNLTANGTTATTTNLTWTASTDNTSVLSYDVYKNGSFHINVSNNTANITGLTAGTTYSFKVKAKDGAGNTSGFSNTRSVTTQTQGDPEPCEESNQAAYYSFDDGVTDQSGNNHNGTNNGASPVIGKLGNALNFDGNNDYVSIGNFNISGNKLTLAAWIKADDFGTSDARIISKATGVQEQDHTWMLSTLSSGGIKPRFRLKTNGTTHTLVGTQNLNPNTWYHVVATYDGSKMRLYVNGVEKGNKSKTGSITTSGANIRIGDNPVGARHFDGVIDEVHMYNKALSTSEIVALRDSTGCDDDDNPEPTTTYRYLKVEFNDYKNFMATEVDWITSSGSVPLQGLSSNNSNGMVVTETGTGNPRRYQVYDNNYSQQNGVWIGTGTSLKTITLDLGNNTASPTAIKLHKWDKSWSLLNSFKAYGSTNATNWDLLVSKTNINGVFNTSNSGTDIAEATFSFGGTSNGGNGTTNNSLLTNITVYPNPTSNILNVDIPNALTGNLNVRLVSITGKLIWTKEIDASTNTKTFDISALATGLYILEFKNNSELHQVKIIKQ